MSDNSRVIAAAILGAIGGAAAGYLLFTDRGRTLRRQFDAALEDTAAELYRFGATVRSAAGFANEGWKLMLEAFGEAEESPQSPNSRQTGSL